MDNSFVCPTVNVSNVKVPTPLNGPVFENVMENEDVLDKLSIAVSLLRQKFHTEVLVPWIWGRVALHPDGVLSLEAFIFCLGRVVGLVLVRQGLEVLWQGGNMGLEL